MENIYKTNKNKLYKLNIDGIGDYNEISKIKHLRLDKIKNNFLFMKSSNDSDGLNFYNIPVVDFDENKNNSYLWQKIPENEIYSRSIYQKYLGYTFLPENIKYNKVDLSKSAYEQSGFFLKAVVKGKFNSSLRINCFKLFTNNIEKDNKFIFFPPYHLFHFDCVLKPEIDIDIYWLMSLEEHKCQNNINQNSDTEQYILNDEKTKDFTIIIQKDDEDDINNEDFTYLRDKCKIKNESNNNIFFIHKEVLIKHSEYFKEFFLSDSSFFIEKKEKEIILPYIDSISFYQILYYSYKGYFPDQELYNMYDWISLLIISSRFLFQKVFNYCEYKLKNYVNVNTVYEILKYSKINNAIQLKHYCNLFIKFNGLDNNYVNIY
ncbi:hypothetical protein BCR32DRAFT_300967 [Anaeromyces robustus]|uniref:BTB domain-containing protein n=1 Tax=Anaeromyces robustus TaxID=1754192 RepID=A0A1Y1X139_9FUNG|nr:hypothetical protein BCR32DRAFT_300967 [Anaeromyces robustus]|eukprot:ORX79318.1 hypothetical protein BCR32DRAFT_300967 [Anaeromyces robustus]